MSDQLVPLRLPPVVPGRRIVGYSAVLLPHTDTAEVDWDGFESLLGRTLGAGLIPAVNMDTGYVQLLTEADRTRVLTVAVSLAGALVQASGIDLHPHFNHNDLFHVIEIGGLYCFYRAGRSFQ